MSTGTTGSVAHCGNCPRTRSATSAAVMSAFSTPPSSASAPRSRRVGSVSRGAVIGRATQDRGRVSSPAEGRWSRRTGDEDRVGAWRVGGWLVLGGGDPASAGGRPRGGRGPAPAHVVGGQRRQVAPHPDVEG